LRFLVFSRENDRKQFFRRSEERVGGRGVILRWKEGLEECETRLP